MKVSKIYIDMDGVLADFDRGVREILNMPVVDQMHKTSTQDDALFEAMAKSDHFYNRLEFIDKADEMFHSLYNRYGDKVEILSGIPKPRRGVVTAAEDKREWMKRKLSDRVKVNIVYREEKKNYCLGPDYILIDDFLKNITEWEQMGGTGILFEGTEETLKKLKKMEDSL